MPLSSSNTKQPLLFPELEPAKSILPADATVVVSISGGKDSIATLLMAIETFNRQQVMAHHQIILEDWPGTVEYCHEVCEALQIPLYATQAIYQGYECLQCHNHYLTSAPEPHCRKCSCRDARFLTQVSSVLDLVKWREKWPSLDVRFCTSYFKRDNFNRWARAHRDLLGPHPLLALGERWKESKGRARLPVLRNRPGLEWIQEWRPVLSFRRIDVFRKMRDYQIKPHYCYKAQGMSEQDMYDQDVEGGPRMSCVMCFLKSEDQMRTSYQSEAGRPIIERGIEIERTIGHTIQHGRSLEDMLS
ncbi:phosphoadenosine phosphosulfate reductase family protein [Dictyobacter formicarum]|uniref:Phosphoadenosine phosphosulphate reductase domain-containing protein n=1 Tax=Dictyobacter formicarum TaxID=2778368 RepID=A0ABQ3VPM5_9CHLR|nr:phosphoadenosine phosphosulfate reductase family protein [Dictyobacter formicarum]GHO88045.1 hypothetical protein KSZ_60510 [Dictyobacter formicarum]